MRLVSFEWVFMYEFCVLLDDSCSINLVCVNLLRVVISLCNSVDCQICLDFRNLFSI